MLKVLICEDEMLVRAGLVSLLNLASEISKIEVIGEAANGREAVEKVALLSPDAVLMDVRMPIMDGLQATRIITEKYHKTCVIILSTYDYEEYVLEGIKAGAAGYVLKDSDPLELVNIIERVCCGERFIQAAVASKILFDIGKLTERKAKLSARDSLTEREVTIITLLSYGMSNREVAVDLNLSEGTIRNYVSGILSKLQASNRIQAINLARRYEII
ncbi:MAG TPA: response regulator transcription factor [Chloroflexia bacterium]|jgi:DNA-binding NarL/FixJ family response regulator|nr:response regulator transcription factor [Chloroflexia bacterium]